MLHWHTLKWVLGPASVRIYSCQKTSHRCWNDDAPHSSDLSGVGSRDETSAIDFPLCLDRCPRLHTSSLLTFLFFKKDRGIFTCLLSLQINSALAACLLKWLLSFTEKKLNSWLLELTCWLLSPFITAHCFKGCFWKVFGSLDTHLSQHPTQTYWLCGNGFLWEMWNRSICGLWSSSSWAFQSTLVIKLVCEPEGSKKLYKLISLLHEYTIQISDTKFVQTNSPTGTESNGGVLKETREGRTMIFKMDFTCVNVFPITAISCTLLVVYNPCESSSSSSIPPFLSPFHKTADLMQSPSAQSFKHKQWKTDLTIYFLEVQTAED